MELIAYHCAMKLKDPTKEHKIIDVTLDIVHAKGLMGVKMSEVAKKVKISPSNLYIYFKNKEDLLLSVFFKTFQQLIDHMDANLPEDPIYKKKIFGVFQLMLQAKTVKRREFSFIQQFVRSPYFQEQQIQQVDVMAKNIFDIFREGQKEMILLDDVDVELILALIDGTTSKLVEFHSKGKITLDKKTIDQSFSMIWRGIRQ